MESKVNFLDGMDVDPADMNNVQKFAERSLNNVVADAIAAKARYAAFFVIKNGPTTVRVAPGRLYSSGRVYARNEEYNEDFTTSLPVAGKKIAAIVTWGTTVQTDSRPREFLINEETGASEPRVVAMEEAHIANVNTVLGAEAPDPIAPLVDIGITVIAHVLLSPTGVESVTMVGENKLANLTKVDERTTALEDFRSKAEPRISTLQTDIAKIAGNMSGRTDQAFTLRLAADVARLKEKAGLPDDRIDYGSDHFLDTDETDLTDPRHTAKVEEGIRFAPEAESVSQLQVFDSLSPHHTVENGWLFPAYERVLRFDVGTRTGELSIAQYQYQTHEMTQLTASRQRIRYGEEFTVCTNAAWWTSGSYDPISGIFTKNGETWLVGHDVDFYGGGSAYHQMMRVRRFWYDTYEEPYWDQVTIDHTVQGAQVSQTHLNGQDGWLDAIGLSFTRLADDGAVHIALTESVRGEPNKSRVLAVTSLTRDKLKQYPEKTIFPMPPTYMEAGKRYGFVITTSADHWIATGEYGQGTLFYSTDGAYQQGDLTKDVLFSLYFKEFKRARVVVDLAPLQLSGGIAAIDLLASAIAPASTSVTYEIQVGSVWYPLEAVTQTALIGLPPLLPLRAVFVGTTDMMPGVQLSGSQLKISRPRKEFWHRSTTRTLPVGVNGTEIIVKNRLEYFDAAYHTSNVKLGIGSNHMNEISADAVSDLLIPDEFAVERTYAFTLPTPSNDFKIISEGATSTALKTFHVAERVDVTVR